MGRQRIPIPSVKNDEIERPSCYETKYKLRHKVRVDGATAPNCRLCLIVNSRVSEHNHEPFPRLPYPFLTAPSFWPVAAD